MHAEVTQALERRGTIDITTIGRRSGQPRRIELQFHNIDGHVYISGRPGFPRGWLANLRANPRFTFHLKQGLKRDLPARARVINDRAERERVLPPMAAVWGYDLAMMIASSPLVEVTFEE